MKILFITSSFEPGKDGVGDYTLLFAKTLIETGREVAVLAWNDVFISDTEKLVIKDGISYLRLPYTWRASKKEEVAHGFIRQFEPDVVSIQMVCFGFHPRGWIFGLGKSFLCVLPEKVIIQVMFHELWLGLAKNHPWKEKVYGWVQSLAIRQFLRELKPKVIHVSNSVYYAKLKSCGLPVFYLPLPSNVPINTSPDFEWIYETLNIKKSKREKMTVMLFFGSIHFPWDIDAFSKKMLSLASGKQLVVISVGGQGYGTALWEQMESEWKKEIKFYKLGFRSPEQVSELLQFSDVGICTTPKSLLGKSGTAMAMVEHGLPIVVTRNELIFDFEIEKIEEPYPNIRMWDEITSLNNLVRTPIIPDRIQVIVGKFLEDVSLS